MKRKSFFILFAVMSMAAVLLAIPYEIFAESIFSFPVSKKTIVINGQFNDWTIAERIYQDTNGPDCGNASGQDIQEVYLAEDDSFVYVRFVLNGPLDETFGYKFGEGTDLHIYVGQLNGQGRIFFGHPTIPGNQFPDIPDSFVQIVNNQFEAKVNKNDVKSWKNKWLAAWLDQGTQTVCRDYIPFAVVNPVEGDIDHSGKVDLRDAILGLQITAGLRTTGFFTDADVNNDGIIGLPEVIYILRVLSGIKYYNLAKDFSTTNIAVPC